MGANALECAAQGEAIPRLEESVCRNQESAYVLRNQSAVLGLLFLESNCSPSPATLRPMAIDSIVQQLDEQIRRLQEARRLLTVSDSTRRRFPIAEKHTRGSQKLSPEARARIASAQRARWARQKNLRKPTPQTSAAIAPVASRTPKRRLSAAARARIAAAQKARWAKIKGQRKAV